MQVRGWVLTVGETRASVLRAPLVLLVQLPYSTSSYSAKDIAPTPGVQDNIACILSARRGRRPCVVSFLGTQCRGNVLLRTLPLLQVLCYLQIQGR